MSHSKEQQGSSRQLVSENRAYRVLTVEQAKEIAATFLLDQSFSDQVGFGLPEIDDRYHVWRVPLVSGPKNERMGEIVIDAKTSLVNAKKSTTAETLADRLGGGKKPKAKAKPRKDSSPVVRSELRNTLMLGDSRETLADLPAGSVDLVFTSPPYFNARPDYTDYVNYEAYLLTIRQVIQQAHRVLSEGRFFVMNVSPVLLRRASRSQSSKRIAVPFDMHRLFIEEGFEFIDDIIWEKPEGAGWATGRGRRFAADRNPLQYKAVPVTENVLVYRKETDKLIDWHIRNHPDPAVLERSKIEDGYEKTNIWRITPRTSKLHPAVFPLELAEKVVRYYSFEGDVVLDPFAGIGTTGHAAARLKRRFVLSELDPDYMDVIRNDVVKWLGPDASEVLTVDCAPPDVSGVLV